jgi:uncharacterized protein YbaR (Trm112 family)
MRKLFVLLAAAIVAVLAWVKLRGSPESEHPWPETSPLGALGGEVDPELLSILACPLDKQPVSREGDYLVCSQCGRRYPIRDGIPVMLVEEAILPDQPAGTTAPPTSSAQAEAAAEMSGTGVQADVTAGGESASMSEPSSGGSAADAPGGEPGRRSAATRISSSDAAEPPTNTPGAGGA